MIRTRTSALTSSEYRRLPNTRFSPKMQQYYGDRPRNVSGEQSAYTRLVHRVAPGEVDRYSSLPRYIVNPMLNKNVVWIR